MSSNNIYIKVEGKGCEYLYKRPPSKNFYVRKRGKREIFKSLGTSKITEAKMKRDELIVSWRGSKKTLHLRKTVKEVYLEMIEAKEGHIKDSTLKGYLSTWKRLGDFEDYFVDEITSQMWDRWVHRQRKVEPDLKMYSFRRLLNIIITFAYDNEYLQKKPRLSSSDPKETCSDIYTDEEVSLLLLNATGDLRLMILMAVNLGMRAGEIYSLHKKAINFNKKVITLRGSETKTGRGRIIPFAPIYKEIKAKADATDSKYLFPRSNDANKHQNKSSMKGPWTKLRSELGIDKRFYDLRHTAATRMLRAGINPAIAAKVLGHDIKMFFEVYVKPTGEDLQSEMDKMDVVL